jgi:hypothetical protein
MAQRLVSRIRRLTYFLSECILLDGNSLPDAAETGGVTGVPACAAFVRIVTETGGCSRRRKRDRKAHYVTVMAQLFAAEKQCA